MRLGKTVTNYFPAWSEAARCARTTLASDVRRPWLHTGRASRGAIHLGSVRYELTGVGLGAEACPTTWM